MFTGTYQRDGAPRDVRILRRMYGDFAPAHTPVLLGEEGSRCIAIAGSDTCIHTHLGEAPAPNAVSTRPSTSWLVLDGRLDNRAELADAFRGAKIDVRDPANDAALLWAAYQLWGTECPQHLMGDYAFVLWDEEKSLLFCARDPTAFHPLYYTVGGERFSWASDLHLLFADPEVSRCYDPVYLSMFVVWENTNTEYTPYKAIRCLPPGSALSVSGRDMKTWRWWQLPEPGSLQYRKRSDYGDHLHHLLRQAVSARLQSTDRVCLALSGGIDSSAIAAIASELLREGAVTCRSVHSITFAADAYPEMDESKRARRVADYLQLPCSVVPLRPYLGDTRSVMARYPLPNTFAAFHPLWTEVQQACSENGSDVLLTGDGGDALFGLNPYYLAEIVRSRRYGSYLAELWRGRRAGLSIQQALRWTLTGLQQQGRPIVRTPAPDWLRHPEYCLDRLESLRRTHPRLQSMHYAMVEGGSVLAGLEQAIFRPAGARMRHPFWDRRLIEFCYALPLEGTLPVEGDKPLLRRFVASHIPADLLSCNGPMDRYIGAGLPDARRAFCGLLESPTEVLDSVVDTEALRRSAGHIQRMDSPHALHTAYAAASWLWTREHSGGSKSAGQRENVSTCL